MEEKMLRYFFEKTGEDPSFLFKELKIWRQGEAYTKEQGQRYRLL